MKDSRTATALVALVGVFVSGCERAPDPMAATPVMSVAASTATETEPNNTCSTAQDVGAPSLPLSLAGSLDGFPYPSGDVDFVRLAATPNASVRVDLEGQGTGKGTLGDPFLGFFDSGCNLLATNDDGGGNLNSRLDITMPSDGIAIVAVTGCCDSGFDQGSGGTYELTVAEIVPPANDAFSNATGISALPFSEVVDISVAGFETGEPTPSCTGPYGGLGKTVWYSFTSGETRLISGRIVNTPIATGVGVYTGTSLATLTEVGCGVFGGSATFRAVTGTTYYFQVGGMFGQGAPLEFSLDVTPPPVASFGFNPFDPSVFDVVQFSDFSFDPGGVGIASEEWHFGDGANGTSCCPTHKYAADSSYTAQLTVTTSDGRSASTSQTVLVRTHDVAITKFTVPTAASAGQTRQIVVGVSNKRYPETVEVQLFKGVPGGFQFVGALSLSAPVRPANRTTDFAFNYTFTAADARLGKVTFKAVANLPGARDALPADNEAIAPPTAVSPSTGTAVRCLRPPAGLKGWWPGDGNARDLIGRNDGILGGDATFAAAKVLQGFSFDGAGDDFFAAGTAVNDLQQLTIDAWVKHNSLPPGRSERYVTLDGEKAVLRYDGVAGPAELHFYMRINGELQHIRVDNVLQVGVFQHVAGSYDGAVMRLYLDGVEVGSLPVVGTVDPSIGVEFSSNLETLDGVLDEVQIFGRALTASEVRAIFEADAAGLCKKRS